MRFYLLLIIASLWMFSSCSSDDNSIPNPTPENTGDWLIPFSEVFDGGPGKDGIPSVDNPEFTLVENVDFLSDNELIVGAVDNGSIRAYPHMILDWHEIVNDLVGTVNLAITYCPLTGTAIGWDRQVGNTITEFGVSGKLYNTNLIPYDRNTDSYWSQIGLNCVTGELKGTEIKTYPLIETTWGTWKKLFPFSRVQNTNTGFSRSYGSYPYGDYRTNNSRLIFPVSPLDNRLPGKERVLGVFNQDLSKAYSIELFEDLNVIEDEIAGDSILVFGSKEDNIIVAFKDHLGLTNLEYGISENGIIATGSDGTQLRVDGRLIGGPFSGERLEVPVSFIGYWFSFGAFYSDIELYN